MPLRSTFPEEGSVRPGVGKVGGTGERWGDKGNCLGKELKTDVSSFGMRNNAQFSPFYQIHNYL